AGGSPEMVRKEGASLAARLLDQRRLAWQEQARNRIAQRTSMLNRPAATLSMSRDDMLQRLYQAKNDPRLGAPVQAAFRKRKPEESTDEELLDLLEEIALLRELQQVKDNDEEWRPIAKLIEESCTGPSQRAAHPPPQ